MNDDLPVKSLRTTFEIVRHLAEHGRTRVSPLAAELDSPKSTIHDHLRSLVELGYVVHDAEYYQASTLFLRHGIDVRNEFELFHVARPEMAKLANRTDQNVHLVVEESNLGIVLHSEVGNEAVRLRIDPGTPGKLHATAPGKAILAHLSDEHVEQIIHERELTTHTDNTITDRDALYDELEMVREQGYATDFNEIIEGLQGIAVPIMNRGTDAVEGAVTVYSPVDEATTEFDEGTLHILRESANVIEINFSVS
jgi:DNA-binding IclR family transcriptional regulator